MLSLLRIDYIYLLTYVFTGIFLQHTFNNFSLSILLHLIEFAVPANILPIQQSKILISRVINFFMKINNIFRLSFLNDCSLCSVKDLFGLLC